MGMKRNIMRLKRGRKSRSCAPIAPSQQAQGKGLVRTQREGSCLQAEKRALIRLASTSFMNFQPPENKCVLLKSSTVCDVL